MPNKRLLIIIALLIPVCIYLEFFNQPRQGEFGSVAFAQKIQSFPRQIGGWRYISDIAMDEKSFSALGPQALIFREYGNESGARILLVVVFHENDRWGAHDVQTCYTSQGWSIVKADGLNTQVVKLAQAGIAVNKLEVEKIDQGRSTVLYWWFAQGKKQMTDRFSQMTANICSSLVNGYCASGLVRVSADSQADLEDFIQGLLPALDPWLP
ncbi:MAG: EpsI family protein [Candidatus Schekmanbacteria bacterium]|nr:EpsI family protein [Candidatus Schekmanbacteria bacterium]